MSICSFFGHRSVGAEIRPGLYAEIERHIIEKSSDTFYVGGYGQFDNMTAGILCNMKERYPHIAVYHVLAYLPTGANAENHEKQHPTLYPEGLELVPKKFAIAHRNRWLVAQSDCIIAYVRASWGGAYEALKYAKQQGKDIINLAELSKRRKENETNSK